MNAESHDHDYHQTDNLPTPPLNVNASLRCSFAECVDLTFNHQPSLLRHTRLKHPESLHPIHFKLFRNFRRITQSNHVLKIALTSKIKCSLCDKWCLRQDGLENHVMQEHTVKEVVIGGFNECTKTFKSGKEFEKHRGIHQQQPAHQANKLNESTNDKSLKSAQLLLVDSGSNEELIDETDSEEDETNETNDSDEASLEEIVLENDTDLDKQSMVEKDSDGEKCDQTEQSLEEMDLNTVDLYKQQSINGLESDEEAEEKTSSVFENLQSQQLEIQQQTFTEIANSIHYANDIENCNNLNQPSITTLNPEIPILINANPLQTYSFWYNLFQNPIDYNYNLISNANVLMESSLTQNNSNIKTCQSNQPEFTEIHHPMSQQIDQSNIELIPMQFTNAMPVQQQIFVSNIDCQQSIISTQTQPMLYRNNFIQMTNDQVNPLTHLLLQTNQLPSIVVPSSIYQFSANQSNPNSTQSTSNLISAQSIVHLNQSNPPTKQSQPEHKATQLNKLINQPSVNCPECGKSYKNKNSLAVHRSTVCSKQLAIVCEVSGCGDTFKTKINLDCHYRWVHNGINWPCRQCKLFKKDRDLMEKHFRIYHEIDLYSPKRELSDQSAKSKRQLENIISNSSTSILSNSTSKQSNPLPNKQTNSFFNHILPNPPTIFSSSPSRSSMLPPSSVIKKKRIYRKISNRVISTNQLPGQDAPRFICNEDNCGKTFTYEFAMKRHQKIVHQGESLTHRCTWIGCGLQFPRGHQLRNHREQAHTGVTVYKCDYPECNKTTTDKGNMAKHRKLVHENGLIMCKYANCGQMFTHYATMMRHRRLVHTAGGKYKCEVEDCGLGFESVAFLRRHCERKHKISNDHL